MSLDIESRIKNIEEIVSENNEMLHKIRRREIFNFWFGLVKLLIVIGAFYYGYRYSQPYIQKGWEIYDSIKKTTDSVKNIEGSVSSPQINVGEILKKLSAGS
jgi:hypothetical protein